MEFSRRPILWFDQELKLISPDLRLVWGRERTGVELWVIERQIPPEMHAMLLADFSAGNPGEDRYFDQIMTGDNGEAVGIRHFDRVPEWAVAHIVYNRHLDMDDPNAYREPDQRDLDAIRHWIFDYKNIEEQLRAVRAEQEQAKAANRQERVECLARDIVNSRSLFEDPPFFIIDKRKALEGTTYE